MEATTHIELSEPTVEAAKLLTSVVDDDKRLIGLKMAAMGGSNPSPLHSVADAEKFIHIDDYEQALTDRNSTVGYIDPKALALWIEEVFGDSELAGAIRATAEQGEFYGAYAMAIKGLLAERLEQCSSVLQPTESGA